MKRHDADWPARPETWPDVLTEIQVCQLLHLDDGRTIDQAKRALRYLRREQGLPDCGRIGRRVLFRLSAVEAWLAAREAARKPLQTPVEAGLAKETGVFHSGGQANTLNNAPIAASNPVSTTQTGPTGRTEDPRPASGGHGR